MLAPIKSALFCASLLAITIGAPPSFAQTAATCDLSAKGNPQGVLIGRSWEADLFDGAGGIDTFKVRGPNHIFPRPGVIKSFEVFDLENGLFDTAVISAEVIATTELGEIEVFTDWFDQVILDPDMTWSRTTDAAFSSQIYTTIFDDRELTVRTDLNTHVLSPSGWPLQTTQGPLGVFDHVARSSGILRKSPSNHTGADVMFKVATANSDVVYLHMTPQEKDAKRIEIDTRNGSVNAVMIDINNMDPSIDREVTFKGDVFDRLILPQLECWDIANDPSDALGVARYSGDRHGEITLIASRHHFAPRRLGRFTAGRPKRTGVLHLSADGNHLYDQINLANGEPDHLILRNSGHLRPNFPVIVHGDPGLDRVWIEGGAGWKMEYQDLGVAARVPHGADADLILAFMPGLEVSLLPAPGFLSDPRLLELPFYPGIGNEVREQTQLFVTRAGFVKFSANQIENKALIDFTNGAANTVLIAPEQLTGSSETLELYGDLGLDTILTLGMPTPVASEEGRFTWTLQRPDGTRVSVEATGFGHLESPHATERAHQ